MGWLAVVVGLAACVLLWTQDAYVLLGLASACTVVCLWSYGVMHNYAVESAKGRRSYGGGFGDFTARDMEAVPNWLAGLNLAFSAAVLGFLIVGIVLIV